MDSYTQGFERSYTVNSSILHGIEPRLKDFHQLLLSPPKVRHLIFLSSKLLLTWISGFPLTYSWDSWVFLKVETGKLYLVSFEEKFTLNVHNSRA